MQIYGSDFQRECVHAYDRDGLGRLTQDRVTTLGMGVDGAVRRLSFGYEVRGMRSKLTSYDSATVGTGAIVNEVGLTYNSFGQLITDEQSHSGAVVSGTTPKVQYAFANGSANTIRPTTLTYPNGRALTIGYGTSGGINDSLSRVNSIADGATTLAGYSYLGLGTPVETAYPEPGEKYTLLGSSSGNSPAGDIYWGLDAFGRIIDSRWYATASGTDIDRIKYGYNRASNRIWRQNPVATAAGAAFDEAYTNDGLQRLKDMQRGTLNGTNTAITSPTFKQCWTLDSTGNWRGFNESTNGSSWTLNQNRVSNPVNEITGISTTTGTQWATPAYDRAGNMTTIPTTDASVVTKGWENLTIDEWASMTVDGWDTLPIGTTTGAYAATYDAWNRMVSVVDIATSNTIQQNQYDARNFRTVVFTYAAGVLSETRHSYFTSSWQNIEERVGTATTADKQFVWGVRYIDDLICRDRTVERLYAHQDANWNVTSISNPSGSIQERYAYSAYGTPSFLSPSFSSQLVSNFTWETLFSGYRYDNTPQLFHVRFRVYHSSLGNWGRRDPLNRTYLPTAITILKPDIQSSLTQASMISRDVNDMLMKGHIDYGVNSYEYPNPLCFTDPMGLESRKDWDDESRRIALCQTLMRAPTLRDFVESYDPTFSKTKILINLEVDTELYGNVDVDWMLTLLNAHYGNADGAVGWLTEGADPASIYLFAKPAWIVFDGLTDPNAGINFNRFGKPNEQAAIRAAQDLLRGIVTLQTLFNVDCSDMDCPPPRQGGGAGNGRNRRRGDFRTSGSGPAGRGRSGLDRVRW